MSDIIIVGLVLLALSSLWVLIEWLFGCDEKDDWMQPYDDDDPNKPF